MENSELIKRHRSEIEFHEKKYKSQKQTIYDCGFTDLIFRDMMNMVGDLNGKIVLDFGCGTGWLTKILLEKGAKVYAFDISPEAVKLTIQEAKSINKEGMLTAQIMPAESLIYPDNHFDLVVGIAILHHLDVRMAAEEIHRVLKPGGNSFFMEPLNNNPLINIYRKLTPDIRSVDEKPFSEADFLILNDVFKKIHHKEYYFLTLGALFWYYCIYNYKLMTSFRDFFFHIDKILLRKFNVLNKFCWYSIIQMNKQL